LEYLSVNEGRYIPEGKEYVLLTPGTAARKCEETKGVIKSCKSEKDRQCIGQQKKDKAQAMIYKTLNRKLKI